MKEGARRARPSIRFMQVSCFAYSSTVKMEVSSSSETFFYFQRTTWSYISGDKTHCNYHCEILKSRSTFKEIAGSRVSGQCHKNRQECFQRKYCDVLPESRNIGIRRYGYREATASLNAFLLQRASRLLDYGWPELDMFQTVRRWASTAR
jgi:hypothetical protein